ncbi:unnamed protein product [Cylindrotheca closterium]|uniref:FHA domain-containing protein n=1 Tax=Cylindrotheca closterium TaxID=2856 RepID=A0AAD2G1D6_9STRA|nr:unnamed protein product [Cylindrotheca closterium]
MSDPASSTGTPPDHSCDTSILTAKYLMRHSSEKDLIHRMRKILQVLQHDECIEANAPEYPGLAGLCLSLTQFVDHQDKESDTLKIFRQTIRQLASLAHTTSPKQPNFHSYMRILELLAEVKIAVLLVELHKDGNEGEALSVLAELFRTILQSVRTHHPHEVFEMTQKTISGCLEEYGEGVLIPTALLDELLICVGQGPIVLVTDPSKAAEVAKQQKSGRRTKTWPPHQVEQENPSYVVASAIIRKTVDRLSTPIANLLNGLLNTDPRVVAESSILNTVPGEFKLNHPKQQDQSAVANVWNVVYEFHRIAPSILTTVIGTLSNYLTSPELEQRLMVVRLLGRLFCGDDAKLAVQFRSCFREWLRRTNDIDPKIRLMMVEYLLILISSNVTEVSADAQHILAKQLTEDSSHLVRLRLIHGLCDVAHEHRDILCQELWKLVGSRVSAKNKQERKDAVTGLAQNYFTNYTAYHLLNVQDEGDDCSLDTVRKALRTCAQQVSEDNYSWIPDKIFQAASFGDTVDPDLRNRVFLVMDEILLGSELPNSSKRLSATTRSAGLAILVHSLKQESVSNSYAWVGDLLKQRSRLQKASREYLGARRKIKEHPQGSEQSMAADAEALDKLEVMACMTGGRSMGAAERSPILESFHRAKDKNIFRILATISNATHSNISRSVAFEELPKRVKNMGEDTVKWVKTLVRRCAMGEFINKEVVRHCILLADECFQAEDIESSQKFLECVYLAVESFPELCSTTECFGTLIELFVSCRMVTCNKMSRLITRFGVLSTLSAILSSISPHVKPGMIDVSRTASQHLFDLCSVDGTPEQARHAVGTIANLYGVKEMGSLSQEQNDAFTELLDSLTAPSKLFLSDNSDPRLITILVALAELSLHSSEVFHSVKGRQSIQFALDLIRFGRQGSGKGDQIDTSAHVEIDQATPSNQSRRHRKLTSQQMEAKLSDPSSTDSIIDDSSLSVSCRTYCAAIQFVTSFIRADCISLKEPPKDSPRVHNPELEEQMFDLLTRIILDHGLSKLHINELPMEAEERRALKQCACICVLRLCDPRLRLDRRHLTTERWHILAETFLEDEREVREALMKELSLMLTGNGSFGNFRGHSAMVPLLRLIAFVTLCVDGDNGLSSSAANGNAANVGKTALSIRYHTRECVIALRKAFEATAVQARAHGAEAEKAFESKMKVSLMPEFVVLYAFHLLSFRPETPLCWSGSSSQVNLNSEVHVDENGERILRKRLKWLFDPLVLSLGDSADNISFLLRMTEALGSYEPIMHTAYSAIKKGLVYRPNTQNQHLAPSKLKVVCLAAREVLLSYVKNDVNLAFYPGQISLPAHLYQRGQKHITSRDSVSQVPWKEQDQPPDLSNLPISNGSKSSDSTSVDSNLGSHENLHSLERAESQSTSAQMDTSEKASGISPLPTHRFTQYNGLDSEDIAPRETSSIEGWANSEIDLTPSAKDGSPNNETVSSKLGKRSQFARRPDASKRHKRVQPRLRARKSTRILSGKKTGMPYMSIKLSESGSTALKSAAGKENAKQSKSTKIRRSPRHVAKEPMH